jgi:hypothetical protein
VLAWVGSLCRSGAHGRGWWSALNAHEPSTEGHDTLPVRAESREATPTDPVLEAEVVEERTTTRLGSGGSRPGGCGRRAGPAGGSFISVSFNAWHREHELTPTVGMVDVIESAVAEARRQSDSQTRRPRRRRRPTAGRHRRRPRKLQRVDNGGSCPGSAFVHTLEVPDGGVACDGGARASIEWSGHRRCCTAITVSAPNALSAPVEGISTVVVATVVDDNGHIHRRHTTTYFGLPVLGGDFTTHSRRNGRSAGPDSGRTPQAEPGARDLL